MTTQLPDVPRVDQPGLYNFLQAVKQQLRDISTAAVASAVASSGREPRSFALDFGGVGDGATSNDTQFAATEAAADSTIYIGDGIFASSLAKSAFTKRYKGSGLILLAAAALPANYAYAATKPTTWPVQGEAGWFRGDQRFTDGGEWKTVGASVRTYDVTARYYESNLIPHHAWFDVESGSSGAQAYLTSGAAAGAVTVTINAAASAEWVGKQVNITSTFGGGIVETLTVQSISGNTVTFTTPLTHTYTWNPSGGSAPALQFAPRTWNGFRYIRVRHRAGGDGYGHIVRLQIENSPKTSELAHTFMAGTAGGYGGDINFIAGSSGMYATAFEWAVYDQGNDVAHIAYVHSFQRDNDRADNGGRVWLGTYFKSAGKRATDVAHVVAGSFRQGLDTALAFLKDSSYLVDPAATTAVAVHVNTANGAVNGKPIVITDGVNTYSGTITGIAGTVLSISPGLNANYAANSYVEYPAGGAIVNAALGQKMIWNSTASNAARGADPLGVFGPNYGNVQGDIETGTDNDGSSDFWYTRYNGNGHGGATARIRLRPTSFSCNVDILGGNAISATKELISNGYTGGGTFSGAVVFSAGSGNEIRFNTVTNNFEFYKAGALATSL